MRSAGSPRVERSAPGAAVLAQASRAVQAVVFEGRSAADVLAATRTFADRPAVRAVALGTLRWYLRLAPAVETLTERPAGSLDPPVRALLAVAAHQIEYSLNVPEMTVDAAVDAARALGLARARGLVNAVLRRFVADREAILARVDADRARRTAHPQWLVEALDREWPQQSDRILQANNAHPPMVLRVDLSRRTVAGYSAELAAAGLGARSLDWCATAIELERPVTVAQLPGFEEGCVSVQDAGAQLAAPLLDARPGMRVLDACAAPGGKTGHLLEHTPDIDLTALDVDATRLERVRENLKRQGREARLVAADLRASGFFDGRPFERILLDAPCSSTGVIRRHPDIKLLRRPGDIQTFAALQIELLGAAFRMLAPRGRLLYATCSILAEENARLIGRFLATEPHARPYPLAPAEDLAPGAVPTEFGVQLLPGARAGTDGFHYACIEKATTGT